MTRGPLAAIESCIDSLATLILRDCARVRLGVLLASHGRHPQAIKQLTSISDPLCKLWAAALMPIRLRHLSLPSCVSCWKKRV